MSVRRQMESGLAKLGVVTENDLLLLEPADVDRMCSCDTVPGITAKKFLDALDR